MGIGGRVHFGQGDGEKEKEGASESSGLMSMGRAHQEKGVPLALTAGRRARAPSFRGMLSHQLGSGAWAPVHGAPDLSQGCGRAGWLRQGPAGRVQRLPVRSSGTGRSRQGGQCSGLASGRVYSLLTQNQVLICMLFM